LAERGQDIFDVAEANNTKIGFEAAVCGAIPIIKTIKESFTGDKVMSHFGNHERYQQLHFEPNAK
jgi:homoserine dehydrogenase